MSRFVFFILSKWSFLTNPANELTQQKLEVRYLLWIPCHTTLSKSCETQWRSYSVYHLLQALHDKVHSNDHDSVNPIILSQEIANEMADAFLNENLPENMFGAPKAGPGMWASCIRVLDPSEGNTLQQINLEQNEAAVRYNFESILRISLSDKMWGLVPGVIT